MNGRIYDPEVGRMMQADPIVQFPTFGQSYNRYAYVLNNPLTFTDPSGFESFPPGNPGVVDSDLGACSAGRSCFQLGNGGLRPGNDPNIDNGFETIVHPEESRGNTAIAGALVDANNDNRATPVDAGSVAGIQPVSSGQEAAGQVVSEFSSGGGGFPLATIGNLVALSVFSGVNGFDIDEAAEFTRRSQELENAIALIPDDSIEVTGVDDGDIRTFIVSSTNQIIWIDSKGGVSVIGITEFGEQAVKGGIITGVLSFIGGINFRVPFAAKGIEKSAKTPIGRRGNPLDVPRGTNTPARIGDRDFTGHALDQMQSRGVTPTTVLDTIKNGTRSAGRDGASIFKTDQLKVVLNPSGSVKTVITQ